MVDLLPTWALETNYGAAPGTSWGAKPCKVAPAGDMFVPGTLPAADEFNYLFNTYGNALASCMAQGGLAPALNWQTVTSAAGTAYATYWDDGTGKWVIATYDSSGTPVGKVYESFGMNDTPQILGTLGSSSTQPTDVVRDSSGQTWTATVGSGNANIYTMSAGGGLVIGNQLVNAVSGGTIVDAKMAIVGSLGAVALGGTSVGNTWLGQLGSPFTVHPSVAVSQWILKSNGSYAVAIGRQASGPAYKTADGVTWTAGTVAWGASDVPVGLAWGLLPSGASWLLAVAVSGGSTIAFYSSSDGLNWTATGATLVQPVTGLTAIGALWIGLVNPGGSGRPIFSLDGAKWYGSQAWLTLPSSGAPPRIVASRTQCAIVAATGTGFRFSFGCGLPKQL